MTYALSWYDASFANEFLFRLPFAMAGILSVLFFYCLVRLYFEKRIALYAAFLFLVNGIIVGLSRIVQYQTFVMLGTVLCLYWLTLAVNTERYRISGLYLAAFAAVVACLAHFDGFFIIPPAILLLYRWICRNTDKRLRRHVFFSVALFVIPNIVFYFSLYFNLASETVDYWQERMVRIKDRTKNIFTLYNGWPATYIYLLFEIIGIAYQCWRERETYFLPYPLHSACPASRWDAAASRSSISFAMPGLDRRGFELFSIAGSVVPSTCVIRAMRKPKQ